MMDNAEEILRLLEEFSKHKPKIIPRELDDYLGYVAKTGDPVFKWSLVKSLFREKLLNVIDDFYEDTPSPDLPPCPNVDAFNYDRMKSGLLERLETFHGAPFTVQRICELLTNPRKEYNRADKFMRAVEKNILVVSTREPGRYSEIDSENTAECSINGVQEPNDALESTFPCNSLVPGPDSSLNNENDNLVDSVDNNVDSNHHNNVDRELSSDVSSDSDEIVSDNSFKQEENVSEKPDQADSDSRFSEDESDSGNVSSSNSSPPVEKPLFIAENISEYECSTRSVHSVAHNENCQEVTEEALEHVEGSESPGELNEESTVNSSIGDVPESDNSADDGMEETSLVESLSNNLSNEVCEEKDPCTAEQEPDTVSNVPDKEVSDSTNIECDTSEAVKIEPENSFINNNVSEAALVSEDDKGSASSCDSTPSQSEEATICTSLLADEQMDVSKCDNVNVDNTCPEGSEDQLHSTDEHMDLSKCKPDEPMDVDEIPNEDKDGEKH